MPSTGFLAVLDVSNLTLPIWISQTCCFIFDMQTFITEGAFDNLFHQKDRLNCLRNVGTYYFIVAYSNQL